MEVFWFRSWFLAHCSCGLALASTSVDFQADGSVLRRLNAIPDQYMLSPNNSDHVNNGSAFSELTGRDDFPLGTLRLDSLEVRKFSDLPVAARPPNEYTPK